ncbi:unnamed protein product, partial [Musa textilis]
DSEAFCDEKCCLLRETMPIFLTRLSELRFWRRVSSLFRREEQEEKKISRVVLSIIDREL